MTEKDESYRLFSEFLNQAVGYSSFPIQGAIIGDYNTGFRRLAVITPTQIDFWKPLGFPSREVLLQKVESLNGSVYKDQFDCITRIEIPEFYDKPINGADT